MVSGDPWKLLRQLSRAWLPLPHLVTAFHNGAVTSGDSRGEQMMARILRVDHRLAVKLRPPGT